MTYLTHRPEGFQGRGDARLAQLVPDTLQMLADVQESFDYDSLCLDRHTLGVLAAILVEFAEDLHNCTGIWAAYERYNVEFFGAPLPLTESEDGSERVGLHSDRFRHFLWVVYPTLNDGLMLSPEHGDLRRVADASSAFLSNALMTIPKDSGAKAFLQSPNTHGWDVKRKLVWLGCHSFMFRSLFARFMDAKAEGSEEVALSDDFICQECTAWSGLGVVDILADILDIPEDDRKGLRSWYERHTAPFKVVATGRGMHEAVNLISDQAYRIRTNTKKSPFTTGQLVYGSLVPWRGEWYWSGTQQVWDDVADVDVDGLKQDLKRQNSRIVCRYSKEHERQVRQTASDQYDDAIAFYGRDLMVYPDGLAMMADWQRELRKHWESFPRHTVEEVMEKHALEAERPTMNVPPELVEHTDGVGVFIHPEEGREVMTHFTSIVTGLNRKGDGMTDDETYAICSFVAADNLSPGFVKRVLNEYGDESVRRVFLLQGVQSSYWLDYLLRKHKGPFFRKRYPRVSLV